MNIVGVMMVKNEDVFIRNAIRGITDFVDEIIFIDTGSTDGTVDIADSEGVIPIIDYDLKNTHKYVEGYAGQDVWVFGVDGDEIYDREGLKRLKADMKSGMYSNAYQVQGWYLHLTEFPLGESGVGYIGPPSHTPAKLYNMNNILQWPNSGDDVLFHVGTRKTQGVKARAVIDTWEQSPMRCLHTRFLRRSTEDSEQEVGVRLGPGHVAGKRLNSKMKGTEEGKNYRYNYRKGDVVEVPIWNI